MLLLLHPPALQHLDKSVRHPLHDDGAGISRVERRFVKYNRSTREEAKGFSPAVGSTERHCDMLSIHTGDSVCLDKAPCDSVRRRLQMGRPH